MAKHPPPRQPAQSHDVYVNNNSHFLAQLDRAQRVMESHDHVCIHGLGAAIPLAINLALELQQRVHETFTVSAATSTVELVDDVVTSSGDVGVSTRNNSAIHITVSRSQRR